MEILTKSKIRVLLVDDDIATRAGAASWLGASDIFEVVAQASDGKEGLELIESLQPDLVIFDIFMRGMDGAQFAASIDEQYPRLKRIVFTSSRDVFYLRIFLNYRVQGYLHKSCSEEELKQTAWEVARGGIKITDKLDDDPDDIKGIRKKIDEKVRQLTKKERRVLRVLLTEGGTNQYLAELLNTSVKAVSFHLSHIYEKLEVSRRNELIKDTNKWLMALNLYGDEPLEGSKE